MIEQAEQGCLFDFEVVLKGVLAIFNIRIEIQSQIQKDTNFKELVRAVPSIKIEKQKNVPGAFAEVSESFGIFGIA